MNTRASLTMISADGLVTPRHLEAAGVPPSTFHAWVAAGEWEEWDNHVYGIAGLPRTFLRRVHAAVLAGGERAFASHAVAAHLHGLLEASRPRRIEVTIPFDEGRVPRTAVVHRSRHVDEGDVTAVDGVPVSSVARTICDVAPYLTAARLELVNMDAVRRGIVTVEEVSATVERLGRTRSGSRKLRRVLAGLHPDTARMRSALEVVAFPVIRATGLTGLRIGFRVVDELGRPVAELDFAFPEVLLAVEIDGLRWHATRAEKEYDDRRQNRLVALGWTVLRFSLGDLRDRPEAVTAEIVSVYRRLAASLTRRA